jgi:gliding motility-associated-like protein
LFRKYFSIWLLLFLSCSVAYSQVIDTVCAGFSKSVYTVDSTYGSTYHWTVNGGTILSGDGTSRIAVQWAKQPGLFKLGVTEQNAMGCWGDLQAAYVLVRGPEFATSFPNQVCVNDSVTIKASGGSKYLWSNGQTDSTIRIRLTQDTLMHVTISDTVCGQTSQVFNVAIKAASKPVMSIITGENSVFKNQSINVFYNGDPSDRTSWHIDKPNVLNLAGQGLNVRFRDTGEAIIKVISINLLGCIDSSSTTLEVKDEQLFFPNGFTPNGDGLNDVFKPQGLGIAEYQLLIYNRWGEVIFQTTDYTTGWDGTVNNMPVPSDVYLYQCEVIGPSGHRSNYSGNITVLR